MISKIKPILFFILLQITSFGYSQESFIYEDMIYDDNIKTVQLYPKGLPDSQIRNPVIGLRNNQRLVLEFDELYNDAFNYMAKLIHCNNDWTPSGLSPLQYLEDYNEYPINEFDYSFGTITPYVHYVFDLPKPIMSGNFLLVIYADGDENDVILTRRFLVYESWVNISSPAEILSRSIYTLGKQNLQFDVQYGNVELLNPMDNISVTLLQNHRWDNAKLQVKPTFIRDMQGILEYNHFVKEDAFDAGNEFRRFDIRSLKYFGFHVETVRFGKKSVDAIVELDNPRAGLAFSLDQNLRGKYYIENLERKIPHIENDYATVLFRIQSAKVNGQVHLSGKFTDWHYSSLTKLQYNDSWGGYEGTYVMKQGEYDYQYVVINTDNPNLLEGDKTESRNNYEILVYYRSTKLQADLLIGYQNLSYSRL